LFTRDNFIIIEPEQFSFLSELRGYVKWFFSQFLVRIQDPTERIQPSAIAVDNRTLPAFGLTSVAPLVITGEIFKTKLQTGRDVK